jgi:hypothetical protein
VIEISQKQKHTRAKRITFNLFKAMGNICSGDKPEVTKNGAFRGTSDDDSSYPVSHHVDQTEKEKQQQELQTAGSMSLTPAEDLVDGERRKALREEQARLDSIVSLAGRGMVAVRSTRGSTGYYDQGFAAALAQHLEQTTQFPDQLEVRLPPPSNAGVYARLTEPQWESIALGTKGGLAGCAGENPNTYMDHVAESLLDTVVPAKQQLFAGVSPMIENLL